MFCLLYINYKRDNVQKYHSYAAYKKHKEATVGTVGTRTFNAQLRLTRMAHKTWRCNNEEYIYTKSKAKKYVNRWKYAFLCESLKKLKYSEKHK